jgi:hypothetical protein
MLRFIKSGLAVKLERGQVLKNRPLRKTACLFKKSTQITLILLE